MAEQDRDRSRAMWTKSSYSNNGGACVEVATNVRGGAAVRDSKDCDGAVLVFHAEAWREFTGHVKSGRFDVAVVALHSDESIV